MTKQEHIAKIIDVLENIRARPGMYISSIEPNSLMDYLHGLYAGCYLCGGGYDQAYHQSAYARGWHGYGVRHPFRVMQEKGLDNAAIINEMLMIEIEAWQKRAQKIE